MTSKARRLARRKRDALRVGLHVCSLSRRARTRTRSTRTTRSRVLPSTLALDGSIRSSATDASWWTCFGPWELGVPVDTDGPVRPHTDHSAGHGTPPGSLSSPANSASSRRCSAGPLGPRSGDGHGAVTGLLRYATERPRDLHGRSALQRRSGASPLGLTDDPVRFNYNFFLIDQASPGTPLILDGDTVRHRPNQVPRSPGTARSSCPRQRSERPQLPHRGRSRRSGPRRRCSA